MSSELELVHRTERGVVSMLENARSWLAQAVETTGPAEIAAKKAVIVTAATYARELSLSKEIQADAQEMVRRAEYALGKAIRKGQAEGTIRTRSDGGRKPSSSQDDGEKPGPTSFASLHELSGQRGGEGIYAIAEADADQFEAAISEAKAEGKLSRANVARKVRQMVSPPQTRDDRADVIAEMAAQGYSSRQMEASVGVQAGRVREIARAYNIDIPADKVVGRTRRINSTHVAEQTVTALEGLLLGIELIDYDSLDLTKANQWVDSLTHSLRALNRFHKKIKEATQ